MTIEVYCDESRQDLLINKEKISSNNKYTVLGGIWIDKDYKNSFKDKVKELRSKYNVYGEIK